MPHPLINWLTPLATLLLALALTAHPAQVSASMEKDKAVTKAYSLAQARLHGLEFSATLAKERQNWLLCAKAFDRAYQLDPDHPSAPNMLFAQGELYAQLYQKLNDKEDITTALVLFDKLTSLFPKHNLADDALYQAATINDHALHDNDRAMAQLSQLLKDYPTSELIDQAKRDLARLTPAAAAASGETPSGEAKEPAAKPEAEAQAAGEKALSTKPATIVSVRPWSTPNYSRVIIETSAPIAYQDHLLKPDTSGSKRLYLDLENCLIPRGMRQAVPGKNDLLQRLRSAQFDPKTARVVLDTAAIANYQIFTVNDPFRIIIDIKGQGGAKLPPPPVACKPKSAPPEGESKPPLATSKKAEPPPPTLAQQLCLGIKRVVLDPGHGGKDPGAIGINGMKEKDIVLAVAKKVARKLSGSLGVEVFLTRKTDIFIPLEERTAIANTKNGDLFISIHANAAKSPQAQGIETYYLDLAASEESRGVAALENASSTRQISDLQNILSHLMQNSKKDESARLAGTVQKQLVAGLTKSYPAITNHGVKTAPFVVLIGAQMPSILTEIAFISNPTEGKRLQTDAYQEALAEQISQGVAKYSSSLSMAQVTSR